MMTKKKKKRKKRGRKGGANDAGAGARKQKNMARQGTGGGFRFLPRRTTRNE